jgi:large subunit ribosomal protein L23
MNYRLTPHITEKSYTAASEANTTGRTFTFTVSKGMSKELIKKMVEAQFQVSVVDVRTIHLNGKVRRFRGTVGRTQDVRKALVRLQVGQNIPAFDLPTQSEGNE